MLLDKMNVFSDAQAFTTGANLSTYSIDLGTVGTMPVGGSPVSDIGRGESKKVFCQVSTTFTSGGSGTVKAELVMADNAALDSNLVVLSATDAIPVATLVAGYQFRLGSIPPGVTKRYLGMRYTVATADMTAGKITSGIVDTRQSNPGV